MKYMMQPIGKKTLLLPVNHYRKPSATRLDMIDFLSNCGLMNLRIGRLFSVISFPGVRLAVLGFLVSLTIPLKSQTLPEDTTAVIEKIVMEKDTMVSHPDPLKSQRKWSEMQQKPIDSILFRQHNTRFSKELYNLLIRDSTGKMTVRKTPVNNADLTAKDGLIIRNIEYRHVDMFAPSVSDTLFMSGSRIEGALNGMHRDTRKKILAKQLLLSPGDPLDVFLVAENERILRDLPFILDAQFLAKSIPGSPDSVDLLLLTQDWFPLGFEADIRSSNAGSASIWHQNMLGFGHQSMITAFWDGDYEPLFGYGVSYGIPNLAGTFTTARLEYIDRWNLNSVAVDFTRDFRTYRFKYGGGILIENTSSRKDIELLDTTLSNVGLKYTNTDLWAGRMIRLNNHSDQMSSGIFLTGRFNLYENHDGPETAENYLYQYQDKTLLLFSAGFSRQGFRKDNLIYTFGRTEDVPYGYHFELTGGVEQGQYNTRAYFSASAAMGKYSAKSGYYFGQAKFGTFFNEGSPEQGALMLKLQYFTRVHYYKRFRYRNFATLHYLNGINRFEGEFVSLENRNGISGLTGTSMRGNDKMVLSLESVLFSPFDILGFRFAFFGSLDLGLIADKGFFMEDSRLYSGLRLGVRIRNDQLVFNTLEINFALYPGIPADGQGRYFSVGSLTRLHLNDFFPDKPSIINYQ